MPGRRHLAVSLLVVVVLSVAVPVGTAAAQSTAANSGEAFVVALDEDGSATVTLRETFDLTTESERLAFRELEQNESRTTALRESFAQRLRGVAAAAETATGRSMRIENTQTTVTADADTGTVAVSATWTGLAAVDGDRIVLSEPFDAEFDPNRTFVVRPPEGYRLSTVEPSPDSMDGEAAAWNADTSLDGFQAVATPAGTGSAGPGFGVITALVAIALLVALRN